MFLNNLWFVLIAILWIGYFVLEGFDFGVGALLRIVGKDEKGRRVLINTIGPVWDANEVWLLTAGGATFAAFPEWYASMFSGFYLALVLILVLLIVRGVAFEYRGKGHSDTWRARWDLSILVTSWGLALLWGVAFGNVVRGVALNAEHEYVGTFLDLLNPFALLMGLTTLLLFLTHGSVYLALKTTQEVRERAQRLAVRLGPVALVVMAVAVVWQQFIRGTTGSVVLGALAVVAMLAAVLLTRANRDGWAFLASAVSTGMLVTGWFASIYPDVFPSTINPDYSLNIENAASTPYTLTVMSWIALLFVPLILGYQAWSYWIFRKRISTKQIPESPTSVPSH
ncbi:cytochrome d ubiquinol oxidase subunit II [Nakamurella multipartita]|uniref:Cytochrome d ubiquinol oxidase, subunit II n=1 Tax=Nakamurella multipartita (strain ATCC 700099 / DSM 44233 / CIP 104796 / JCM 9543 / NBRC 105858 / Y-104) TaxID=479431 RepID=C8XG66_NAKMY|nr:cytochrome d ubiquinol oxidase subunit II [Nakamurella multipartita]ACV80068.1 cytochrome d ubiquinol oxidase, subunit II [Nakamurella multipartita DSM 44233]